MEKENKISYDEAIKRAEEIVQQLEQSEAIGLEEFRRLSKEAKELLAYCREEIDKLENNLSANA